MPPKAKGPSKGVVPKSASRKRRLLNMSIPEEAEGEHVAHSRSEVLIVTAGTTLRKKAAGLRPNISDKQHKFQHTTAIQDVNANQPTSNVSRKTASSKNKRKPSMMMLKDAPGNVPLDTALRPCASQDANSALDPKQPRGLGIASHSGLPMTTTSDLVRTPSSTFAPGDPGTSGTVVPPQQSAPTAQASQSHQQPHREQGDQEHNASNTTSVREQISVEPEPGSRGPLNVDSHVPDHSFVLCYPTTNHNLTLPLRLNWQQLYTERANGLSLVQRLRQDLLTLLVAYTQNSPASSHVSLISAVWPSADNWSDVARTLLLDTDKFIQVLQLVARATPRRFLEFQVESDGQAVRAFQLNQARLPAQPMQIDLIGHYAHFHGQATAGYGSRASLQQLGLGKPADVVNNDFNDLFRDVVQPSTFDEQPLEPPQSDAHQQATPQDTVDQHPPSNSQTQTA